MRPRFRLSWVLTPVLLLTLAVQTTAPPALADDLQAMLEQAQRELQEVQRRQQEVRNALADVAYQAELAEAQLKVVETELIQANNHLAVVTSELEATTAELEQIEADLAQAQAEYEAKEAVLGARIRAIRENGRVNYLEVLLGATSFRDFTGRLEVLSMVLQKDRELFESIKADKLALEEKQRQVADRKSRLTQLVAEAESYRDTVAAKRAEQEQVSRSLQESRRALEAQLDEYDRYTEELAQRVAEIVRQMNRQGGKFAPIVPVSPVIITDSFGMRDHPILGGRRMHYGTDLAAYYGQPVYACEDGVVISAGWDDVYGYLVIIDHGGGITSWYAHNSSILVSVNQTVTQGQQIAAAGSTGWSTGPHVHWEIHVDGERKDPMSFIQ